MNREIDHIDPKWKEGRDYQVICGLDCPLNFCELDEVDNQKKSNRFLPYRVTKDSLGSVPMKQGDFCQFLDPDSGEWVLEEFMGEWWFNKTRKLCGQSKGGNAHVESGHLRQISILGASKGGTITGTKMYIEGTGMFAPGVQTFETRSAAGKRGAEVNKKNGTGLYGVPVEIKRDNGRLTMKYRYMDPDHPELGQHAAPILSRMQNRRGYPNKPENRIRVQ